MDTQPPHCVGFIMDGNRRWAKAQSLPTIEGHKAGESKFYEVAQWIKEEQIPHSVFYAFSSENWNRQEEETFYLQMLFLAFTRRMLSELETWQVRVRVIGTTSAFSEELQTAITELESRSAKYSATTIWVALSYGGRQEIVQAVNRAVASGESVTEASFRTYLYNADMPDPDLIIRTGGEQRLSNFLTWQSVYSELMFTDTYWPAFTKEEFLSMVEAYATRQRRRGT